MITDCDAVRIELFKLNYIRGEFVLNDKADAQECLNFVITQMHTWMQSCTTPPDQVRQKLLTTQPMNNDVTRKLEDLAKVVKCERRLVNDGPSHPQCFIHEMYFLHHQQIQNCSCGKRTDVLNLDENLFGQLVNMAEMEQTYDKIAMEVASANITDETFARYQTMSEQEQYAENLGNMYGLFFEALKQQLIQKENHCLNHPSSNQTPGGVTPMFDQQDNVRHVSNYKNLLQWPFPEVYNFNLGWGMEPKR